MPPKTPQRRPVARPRGNDPTVSIATAATARTNMNNNPENTTEETKPTEKNDDLKKLIETLKSKLGNTANAAPSKQVPPTPAAKTPWKRSIVDKEKNTNEWKPAYTILTRISNHEKVPTTKKAAELTINSVPHSFLYRPGVDGIKIDKLNIKAGKQIGMG